MCVTRTVTWNYATKQVFIAVVRRELRIVSRWGNLFFSLSRPTELDTRLGIFRVGQRRFVYIRE